MSLPERRSREYSPGLLMLLSASLYSVPLLGWIWLLWTVSPSLAILTALATPPAWLFCAWIWKTR